MLELLNALKTISRSPSFKFFLILFLIVLLLVPLILAGLIIDERAGRAGEVRAQVGRLWGPDQKITGPFLVVPYTVRTSEMQGDKRVETIVERHAVFTPEALDIAGRADAKILHRSIYDVPVYSARLKLTGRFGVPRISDVEPEGVVGVRWSDAVVALGLSGVSGLKSSAELKIDNSASVAFGPSLGFATEASGIHAKLSDAHEGIAPSPYQPDRPFSFSADLDLNGSISLAMAPVARETRVALESNWPHPSFEDAFAPNERSIGPAGFTATWTIPHLARSVPDSWSFARGGFERFDPYVFGVRLVDPVDFYTLVSRAVKYGVMFVTLAFMAVFCLEVVGRRRVHAVQYLFAGVAMVFFYVLLLSLAEHVGFEIAYLLASGATGLMLATYVGAVFKSLLQGAIMAGVLAMLFGLLYFILKLEDYALLAGSVLGFTALTLTMFATLRVDWTGRRDGAAPVAQA